MSKAIILPPVPKGGEKVHVAEDTSRKANTLTTVQTTVSTVAVQISTPDSARNFILKHQDPNITVWIGKDDSITAGGTTVWPLEGGQELILDQYQLSDSNQIYAIADSGSVTVYCIGKYYD